MQAEVYTSEYFKPLDKRLVNGLKYVFAVDVDILDVTKPLTIILP
jgi:hypothetical protein